MNFQSSPVASGSSVNDGLFYDNPNEKPETEAEAKIRLGQEAMGRKRRGWTDWLEIGEAIEVGRAEVMRQLGISKPGGRNYSDAMGRWLEKNDFNGIDKSIRSDLKKCLENRIKIEAWRISLKESDRLRITNPREVFRKWKATILKPPKGDSTDVTNGQAKQTKAITVTMENPELFKRLLQIALNKHRYIRENTAKELKISTYRLRTLLKKYDLDKEPWLLADESSAAGV